MSVSSAPDRLTPPPSSNQLSSPPTKPHVSKANTSQRQSSIFSCLKCLIPTWKFKMPSFFSWGKKPSENSEISVKITLDSETYDTEANMKKEEAEKVTTVLNELNKLDMEAIVSTRGELVLKMVAFLEILKNVPSSLEEGPNEKKLFEKEINDLKKIVEPQNLIEHADNQNPDKRVLEKFTEIYSALTPKNLVTIWGGPVNKELLKKIVSCALTLKGKSILLEGISCRPDQEEEFKKLQHEIKRKLAEYSFSRPE